MLFPNLPPAFSEQQKNFSHQISVHVKRENPSGWPGSHGNVGQGGQAVEAGQVLVGLVLCHRPTITITTRVCNIGEAVAGVRHRARHRLPCD